MKLKFFKLLSAAILAMAATAASADPIVIGSQVPGSDHSSEPCTPKQRTDDYHIGHFNADISGSRGKDFDIVLFGDSITDFWNNPSLALDGNPINYAAAFNMGIGSDRVQNLLWRLRNGALDGYTTKYFTLMVGINNGHQKCIDHNEHADRAEDVAESIRLMLCEMATKHPDAKILLMPILPYSFDSRYFEAAEVTAMSEAVNDYILQFVDNKRVFWVDLRSQYLQQNSMPDKTCYREGGHGGYDAVGLCLHPEFFTYSDFWKPALTNAMHRYLAVPAGQAQTADPSIGYAKAAPNADGAGSATITVFGISLGRDANANAVTSYAIDYELDGGAKTRALSGQTGTRASFAIPNVALGDHTCKVTVTTADNKELVTLLDFTMTEPWYASPLPTDDSAIRTDGTLKYAYAPSACTVNGVTFAAAGNNNANISDDISWPYNQTSGASAPSSISGSYYDLLNRCWWANQGDKEVTLKNLTAGRSYLVQVFGYRNYNGDSKAHVWIKESYWDPNFIKVYGDGWSCGGTLTGTFTATESTKTFTIKSDGNYGINGIQVRDLGESGAPVVVQPKIGSASVTTNETAATVFLSGIVMGTDDAGTNANSYAVSYSLNNAAPVTALQNQTAATASFDIANLADGEYTCVVTITTDKNKTSAEKSVSFRIGPPPPEVVSPFIGSASVTTNGTTATIALQEIVVGTDDEGVAASSYSVSYSLNGAAAVEALADQIGAAASFDIADLADGSYKCVVAITTDKNKKAETTVAFRIGEPPPITVGWTVGPMSANGSTIRTDGDLLYAYAAQNGTVGGVSFVRDAPLGSGGMVSASPVPAMGGGSWGTEGVSGDFGTMLQNGWNWTGDGTELSYTLTLAGLTPGKNYLVQLVMHRQSQNMLVSVNGSAQAHVNGSDEENYKYGASIVGLFTASASTQDLTVTYTERGGDRPLNAIQVRYLGDGGASVATVVAPSIGSAAAEVNGSTATISLSGVVMGTDDEGTNATSYAVSYRLGDAAAVQALTGQAGATATFDIANLADGEYTCAVSITTDKNKTSAEKSVSFRIGTPPPEVVAPSIGSASATTSGGTATISLSGVAMGTDDEGVAATSYSVSYSLTNAPAETVLSDQTGATASFQIADLADGSYTCEVTVTTDKNKTASKSVSFAISTSGGGGSGGSYEDGWTAAPLGATSASIRTDGTLLYAYARENYTVNGVAFASEGTDGIDNDNCTVPVTHDASNTPPADTESGDYKNLLGKGWYASAADRTVTLRNLEAGKQYLVQIVASRSGFTTQTATAPDGEQTIHFGGTGWEYGGSLIGVFTAEGTTQQFTIRYAGNSWLNAIQVRELPEGGGGGGETPVCTLTIPAKTGLELVSVTTNGVAVAAAAGNAYSIVSNDTATITFAAASGYEIVSGNPVVLAITGDKTLADAEYPVVRQTGGGGDFDLGWTVSPMSADFASICTNGEPVYAYATHNYSVNGVAIEKIDSLAAFAGAKVSFSPAADGITADMMNEGVADSNYGILLGNAWYWDSASSPKTIAATLTGLVPGNVYLVQLVSHNYWTAHMTVSAGGAEPLPIGSYDTDNGCRYGASVVGVFEATATTQTFDVVFSGSTGTCPINFIQVRQLAGGGVLVVEPSIGSVSAALSGSTATIVLGGVEKGTDAYGTNATSYAVSYSLDGWATETEKLWNQTGASAWFNITNLADGDYVCSVEIVTDKGCMASNSVAFTIDSTAPASTAWILTEMDPAGECVRTDGELLYAHAPHQLTANGVPFEWTPRIADANFSASPVEADASWGWMMNEGVPGLDGYGYLLGHAWFWDTTATDVEVEITLKGLTPGKNYLVQLFSHNRSVPDMRFSVEGSDGHPIGTLTDVEIQGVYIPYRYGTTAVGFFTASDSTQSFKVAWADSTGSHPLNALQVRDLGLAVPVVVEPSIGDASAAVDGTTAVVTLSGVVKGTGDDFEPASSYSVTYALDGGAPVTVLEGRTGATAAFALAGLAEGDHVCVVSIATDKGKTSEAKTVHITIGSQPFEWKTEPMDPSGETISTNGVRVWAYCRGADGGQVIANGVSFTSYEDLDADRLNDKMITLPFSVSSAMLLSADDWGDEGVDGGLGKILSNAFYAGSDGSRTFTLGELEKGHTYLVQLIMHKSGSGTKAQSPFNVADHVQFGQTGADDTWKLGGSLIGTFLAESDTHTFTVKYDGDFSALNAIQLRDLGVTVATESDPSVEAVSAKRKGTTATVTLSGVAMGTDANRHPATSYAVSYRLDGGAWTTALPAENGETASFELSGLDYRNYVCEVMIETDVGKQTAPQSVTLAFAKSDGLTIVCFDAENAALAFDMGSEGSVRTLLPDASAIYCTVVTSTNLEDAVWTPAGPSLAWKANPLPLDDETGWTWVTGLDTADPVRFFRVALTPAALEEDDEVVFK